MVARAANSTRVRRIGRRCARSDKPSRFRLSSMATLRRTRLRSARSRCRAPTLAQQLFYVRTLYDEICRHYGLRVGLRHARKHLGWALEIAADYGRAPAEKLKAWRQKILTSDDPHRVHRALEQAFDDFAW